MAPLTMRILTLNCHKGFSWFNRRFILHELRDALREAAPDIAFLQEVVGDNIRLAKRHRNWPDKTHYEFLAEDHWTDFYYGKNKSSPRGHHGNAVLSRYPILSSQAVNISTNRVEKRGFVHCEILMPDSAIKLHCICVHLSLLSSSRRKQCRMLIDYVEKNIPTDSPLIIAGDFNDWRLKAKELIVEPLKLTEAWEADSAVLPKTFPARMPLLKLDRIYFRGLKIKSITPCSGGNWSELSDHIGLMAEVTPI